MPIADFHRRGAAIVLAAHGSNESGAADAYRHVGRAARARYPGREIRWAWSRSGPASVLAQLQAEGWRQAAMQPLLAAAGQQWRELAETSLPGMRIAVGKPLIALPDDAAPAARAIRGDLRPGAANIVVFHGRRRPRAGPEPFDWLSRECKALSPGVFALGVESADARELDSARRCAAECGRAHFIPFLIAAGAHFARDIMGQGPASLRSLIGAAETTCAQPLAYNERILSQFWDRLDAALQALESQSSLAGPPELPAF